MYQYYNAEPEGKHLEDCVIRAISLALQIPYEKTVELLSENGTEYQCEEICLNCYEKLLNDLGFETHKAHNEKVNDIASKASVVLIRIPGHLTCSIDGVIFDIWDCSQKQADCYWIIDRSKIMLNKIENYINNIDFKNLSMEDLQHYTKIIIMIENAKSLAIEKQMLMNNIQKQRAELTEK